MSANSVLRATDAHWNSMDWAIPNIPVENLLIKGDEDQLKGFKLAEELLYDQYPIIIETKDNIDLISGYVFEITLEELKFTDDYEGEHYRRIQVKLESGREAWCYVM